MPTHWSSRALHIVSTSSSTATQLLHAVGCAEAGRYFSRHPEAAAKAEGDYRAFRDVDFHGDEVVSDLRGRGLDLAGRVLGGDEHRVEPEAAGDLLVEDNGYAISVPVEVNTPGGNISRLVANFPNFHFAEVDGNDPVACLRAFRRRRRTAARARGPALVHGHCVRLYSHSLSDDDKLYRSAAEREADALRDPIARMRTRLIARGHSDEPRSWTSWSSSWNAKPPRPPSARCKRRCRAVESITTHVYSEDLDPTRAAFATEQPQPPQASESGSKARRAAAHDGRPDQCLPARRDAPRPAHRGLWRGCGRRQP